MEKWKRTLLLISIPFLLIPMIGQLPVSKGQVSEFETEPGSGVIDINGDEDLLDIADEKGWIGSGNSSDPIIIDGLDIDYPNGSMGLKIESTTLHIRISNCTFTEVPREIEMYSISSGILMENTKNIIIQNNSFFGDQGIPLYISESSDIEITSCDLSGDSNNYLFTIDTSDGINIRRNEFKSDGSSSGAEIYRSEDIEIIQCDFKDLANGISMYSNNHISINNNTFTSIGNAAIVTEEVNEYTIANNTITSMEMVPTYGGIYSWGIYSAGSEVGEIINNKIESFRGITFLWTSNTVIRNNDLDTLDINIMFYGCTSISAHDNDLTGAGFFIQNSIDLSIENNKLNDGYFFFSENEDLTDVTIPKNTPQVILVSATNASIVGLNSGMVNTPLFIEGGSDLLISNCTFSNCDEAIFIIGSDNVTIENVDIDKTEDGIRLQHVSGTKISDNKINVRYTAIGMESCKDTVISENRIASQRYGIALEETPVTVIDNNLIEAKVPVDIQRITDVWIVNNTFNGGRIIFQNNDPGPMMSQPEGNIQNGRSIHYIFHDCNVSDIPSDGSYTLFYNISEKVISDLDFKGEVEFLFCYDISLFNLSFIELDLGLRILKCTGLEMTGLEMRGIDGRSGVFIDKSNTVSLKESNVTFCDIGILVNKSTNVIVSNSNISNNNGGGIKFVNVSNLCTVEDSTIGFNKREGIEIISCINIIVTRNEITMNEEYGVSISHSTGCLIHTNHFIRNNGILGIRETDRSQAYDMHQENYWYIKDPETTQGNYWSDLTDPILDEDRDGIIDIPYMIESEEGAQDMYPSLHRFDYKEKKEHYKLHGDDMTLLISSLLSLVLVFLMIIFTLVASFRKK